jgi:hypothetical protein
MPNIVLSLRYSTFKTFCPFYALSAANGIKPVLTVLHGSVRFRRLRFEVFLELEVLNLPHGCLFVLIAEHKRVHLRQIPNWSG